MPRPDKGPRLYLKRLKGRTPMWVIRDGPREESTGCAYPDAEGLRYERFRHYLARTFRPNTSQRDLNKIACSEVLMLYYKDMPADSPTKKTTKYHVANLTRFWGEKYLADVKGSTCREYVAHRSTKCSPQARSVKPSTSRQELKTFQAAINHWHRESPLEAVPKVTLPKPGERRERVLERNEVAAMLKAARRLKLPHVARFILIGLYTGTRHEAILNLRWSPSASGGHVDIERRTLYRRGSGERETSKRRPPVRIGERLVGHLRRWSNLIHGDDDLPGTVIHYHGSRILKMKKAWASVRKAAGLGKDVTPHVLRHTCCSWHLWDGKTIWEAAGIIGADASTVERTYGHHKIDGKVRGFEG